MNSGNAHDGGTVRDPGREAAREADANTGERIGSDSGKNGEREADRETVIDFLGLLACIEVTAFEQRGRDAQHADTAADKAAIGGIVAAHIGHFSALCDRLIALGADPDEAMRPFQPAVSGYERRTPSEDVLAAMAKIHLADGLIADFHRQAVPRLDDTSARLVEEVLPGGEGTGGERYGRLAERIAAAAADEVTADRLSLWGRRLAGEVFALLHGVIAARPRLSALFVDFDSADDATDAVIARTFKRSAREYAGRMRALGLTP